MSDHGSNGHVPYDARGMDDWILQRVEQLETPLAKIRADTGELAAHYRNLSGRVGTQGAVLLDLRAEMAALDAKTDQVLEFLGVLKELLQKKVVL